MKVTTAGRIRAAQLRLAAEHRLLPGDHVYRVRFVRESGEYAVLLYRYSTAAAHVCAHLSSQGVGNVLDTVAWDGIEQVSLDNGD